MSLMAADTGSGPRLIRLLTLVAEGPRQFTLGDLAGRSGLPVSTVHRQLQILVRSGMVERGRDQSYRLGRELYRIAALLRGHFDFNTLARPFLERLWSDSHETAVLCAYKPGSLTASVIDAILTPHPLRFMVEIGMELTLPWGSLGRAMLASLPARDVDRVFAEARTGPLSGRPLPPAAEMRAELARIRAQGFADYYDPSYDVAGVAAPLYDTQRQVVGCIGVTMPSQRFGLHDRDALTALVRDSALELSRLIGLQL